MSKYIELMILLLPCTITDLRRMEVPVILIVILSLASAAVEALFFTFSMKDALLGAGLGLVFIVVALAARKSFGMGDGILLTGIGVFAGFSVLLPLLCTAFLLTALYGGAALLFRKGSLKQRIPFVPFLFAAAVCNMILFLIGGI